MFTMIDSNPNWLKCNTIHIDCCLYDIYDIYDMQQTSFPSLKINLKLYELISIVINKFFILSSKNVILGKYYFCLRKL